MTENSECSCDQSESCNDYMQPFDYLYQEKRMIYLKGPIITPVVDNAIIGIMHLSDIDPEKPITIFINSPGGDAREGFALYDLMQEIETPISTRCYGMAASMGALILAAGTPGMRYISPSADVLIHKGQAVLDPLAMMAMGQDDLKKIEEEMEKVNQKVVELLCYHTGKGLEKILNDIETDYLMNSGEALKYGIVDHVIEHKKGIYSGKGQITISSIQSCKEKVFDKVAEKGMQTAKSYKDKILKKIGLK
ncbi:MAG: ATP-dependent Clp protease proteolytic subunit [Candidatus Woesearchaeota archaeon]